MSKKRAITIGVIVILITAVAFFQIEKARKPIEAKISKVTGGSLEQIVSGSGTTEAAKEVGLNFASIGRVETIYVEEGQVVSQGQILASQDIDILRLQRKQQNAAVSEASAAYQKLRKGAAPEDINISEITVKTAENSLMETKKKSELDITAAQATIDNAQRTRDFALSEREEALAEYDKLVKKYEHPIYRLPNYTATQQTEVDTAKATADTAYLTFLTAENAYKTALKTYDQVNEVAQMAIKAAEDQLESAKAQLALKTAPARSEDARATLARVTQAKAQLEIIDKQIEDATINAPFDGTVVKVSGKEGEFVLGGAGGGSAGGTASTGFIIMSDPATIRAVIDVDEADISKVKPGQKAKAFFDAYKDEDFAAKVTRVGDASVKTEGGGTAFQVYVEIKSNGKRLKQGMNVDVDIVVETMHRVVSIPAEAVTTVGGKDVVYAVIDGKAKMREVSIGTSTDTRSEIKSGLKEGDAIVVTNISKIKDGSRIKE